MSDLERRVGQFAEVAIRLGINVQPGQTLVLMAPIECRSFVHELVSRAYDVGARHVYVEWEDEDLGRMKFEKAPVEAFSEYPMWRARGFEEMAREGAAFLSVRATNPDLLAGVDQTRVAQANKTANSAMRAYREMLMKAYMSWCLVAAPTAAWARKVFPGHPEQEAIELLWDAILRASRIVADDPLAHWREHLDRLATRARWLTDRQYEALHYRAPGTDLTVRLADGHKWLAADSQNSRGISFVPNIPTEEVFTMPHRFGVSGTVQSTMPLNYNGVLIEGLALTFEAGRIVHAESESGQEALLKLIETDEGAHRLGEVALVPYHSPISNMNTLFYNTLFDENASCHLAVGAAYPITLQQGEAMQPEELAARGANTSLTHVDFMVGSADLQIDGILKSGQTEAVFRNGDWALPLG